MYKSEVEKGGVKVAKCIKSAKHKNWCPFLLRFSIPARFLHMSGICIFILTEITSCTKLMKHYSKGFAQLAAANILT